MADWPIAEYEAVAKALREVGRHADLLGALSGEDDSEHREWSSRGLGLDLVLGLDLEDLSSVVTPA